MSGLVQLQASEPRGMFLTLKVGFVLSAGEVKFLPSVAIQLPSNQGHRLWILALKTELINTLFMMTVITLMITTHPNIPNDSKDLKIHFEMRGGFLSYHLGCNTRFGLWGQNGTFVYLKPDI